MTSPEARLYGALARLEGGSRAASDAVVVMPDAAMFASVREALLVARAAAEAALVALSEYEAGGVAGVGGAGRVVPFRAAKP